jgi:AP-2 complex subunit alpha
MCNNQNVRDIVDELLKYLEIADFTMRDELVLKTAVLAER